MWPNYHVGITRKKKDAFVPLTSLKKVEHQSVSNCLIIHERLLVIVI